MFCNLPTPQNPVSVGETRLLTVFASVRFAGELSIVNRYHSEIPPAHPASACLHPPQAAAGSVFLLTVFASGRFTGELSFVNRYHSEIPPVHHAVYSLRSLGQPGTKELCFANSRYLARFRFALSATGGAHLRAPRCTPHSGRSAPRPIDRWAHRSAVYWVHQRKTTRKGWSFFGGRNRTRICKSAQTDTNGIGSELMNNKLSAI